MCEQSDSADATGNSALIPNNAAAGCGESFGPGDPTYVFWQLPGDAARITFCPWFLDMAMNSAVPSTNVFADTRRLDELRDRVAMWALNWGPWGYGTPTPNIQNFQLFDAIMISAVSHHDLFHNRIMLTLLLQLTHTNAAGSRQLSSPRGAASTHFDEVTHIFHRCP